MCDTCVAMRSIVLRRPISRKRSSPVASNCSNAEPNWKPCVHSIQPRVVYLPFTVNTGVPCSGFQVFSMLRIFRPESSKSRSILGRSFCGVSWKSIFVGITGFVAAGGRRLSRIQNSEWSRACSRRRLEFSEMKPTIHVDYFPRAEGQQILRDGGHGLADVFRRAPALNGRQTFGDQFVVFVFDGAGHVRRDDARSNFVNVNSVFGQTRGEQRRDH